MQADVLVADQSLQRRRMDYQACPATIRVGTELVQPQLLAGKVQIPHVRDAISWSDPTGRPWRRGSVLQSPVPECGRWRFLPIFGSPGQPATKAPRVRLKAQAEIDILGGRCDCQGVRRGRRVRRAGFWWPQPEARRAHHRDGRRLASRQAQASRPAPVLRRARHYPESDDLLEGYPLSGAL